MGPVSAQTYSAMAQKHWVTWLPLKVARLRAEGALESTLQVVGRQTQAQVVSLMKRGYQQHEAEEVALAEHVLLPPEEAANNPPRVTKTQDANATGKIIAKSMAEYGLDNCETPVYLDLP
jgi:hypothetical protein